MGYGNARPTDSCVDTPPPRAIVTRAGENASRATLMRLRHQLDVEFAERLKQAHAFGETSGNDDYLQILEEEEAVLAYRVSRLETLLDCATVVDHPVGTEGAVAIGTTVEVEDLASGRLGEHRLGGDYEPSSADVSVSSPVGQALIGRAAGDEVDVKLPNGRVRKLKIVAVRASTDADEHG
jgi:transcription elongation factor GreA